MAKLQQVLGYKTILLITINSIMGTGIFFLPAVGALAAGPASLISWAIFSVIAIYISMVFAELTSMFPKAGGVYEFCKQAYGRFWSFIVGWITLVTGNITIAMLVVGAIQYLLPINLPFIKIGLSLFFILVFNYIAYRGMKTSGVMLVTFAFITLFTIGGLVLPGLFNIQSNNLVPFFVTKPSMIFLAIFLIAETFFGWETATFLAAETKDGAKTMPKALITATIIISLISLVFVFTSMGTLHWEAFGASATPLSDLSEVYYGGFGKDVFTILVYMAIIGSVAGWIVSAPRLVLSMAEDGLFLKQFAAIHPVYKTPYKSILLQTVVVSILVFAASGAYETLLKLLVPQALILYVFVMISLVVLRYKKPHLRRYYRAPFGKVGPIIVALLLLGFVGSWLFLEHGAFQLALLGISILLLGFPLYFLIELYYDPKFVRKVDNLFARLAYYTERISLPVSVRKELLLFLGNIKGKKVLEFGCSVGTLTMLLADDVGPKGRVYATDISEHDISIAKERIDKKGHKHVMMIHDIEHSSRVHPQVPKVDAVISVGMLGYLTDVEKVLQGLNKRLKKGSTVVFMDYDKFFDIIPNVEWVRKDETIKKLFHQAGFTVSVMRKQGFAWKYVYIYGVKVKDV